MSQLNAHTILPLAAVALVSLEGCDFETNISRKFNTNGSKTIQVKEFNAVLRSVVFKDSGIFATECVKATTLFLSTPGNWQIELKGSEVDEPDDNDIKIVYARQIKVEAAHSAMVEFDLGGKQLYFMTLSVSNVDQSIKIPNLSSNVVGFQVHSIAKSCASLVWRSNNLRKSQ